VGGAALRRCDRGQGRQRARAKVASPTPMLASDGMPVNGRQWSRSTWPQSIHSSSPISFFGMRPRYLAHDNTRYRRYSPNRDQRSGFRCDRGQRRYRYCVLHQHAASADGFIKLALQGRTPSHQSTTAAKPSFGSEPQLDAGTATASKWPWPSRLRPKAASVGVRSSIKHFSVVRLSHGAGAWSAS